MGSGNAWYAGRCAKRHDIIANVEVLAQSNANGWVRVDNAKRLFPRTGEVEVRGQDMLSLRPGEWVLFQIGQQLRGRWKAGQHRRLNRFVDLSDAGSIEDIRRRLFIYGLETTEQPGSWTVRIREKEVLHVELVRRADALFVPHAAKLPAYAYDAAAVLQMPCGTGYTALYDRPNEAPQLAVYDWLPDDQYLSRVVRSLAAVDDPRVPEILVWLKANVDEATGRLSDNSTDLAAAHEAQRSGELARRLASDRDLLRAYAKTLRSDPKIVSLLAAEVESIAEQERYALRQKAAEQLESEIAERRAAGLLKADLDLATYAQERRAELDKTQVALEAAAEDAMAVRQREIDIAFEEHQTRIRDEMAELVRQCEALAATNSTIETDIESNRTELAALLQTKSATSTDVDRSSFSTIELPGRRPLRGVALAWPERGQPVRVNEIKRHIAACALLTPNGAALMEHFVALTLAGDVPVLVGSQVNDFLTVAETLLSSGASARIVADPTIIAFEDLWVRAGTCCDTALTQGLALAGGEYSTTVLGIIEQAERSGARFWMPALVDRSRRGGFPRRFLLCATLVDMSCEEAAAVRSLCVCLDAESVIVEGAAAIAAATLRAADRRELDPGDRPVDVLEGLRATATVAAHLSVGASLRAARAAVESAQVSGADASTQLALTSRFARDRGDDVPSLTRRRSSDA